MKILAITAFHPPHHFGGYELRCKDVVTGLATAGHQVFVITTRCSRQRCSLHPAEQDIFRVLHRKSQAASVFTQIRHDLADMRLIDRVVNTIQPDLVYFWHLGNLSNAILPYFASRKIPMVYDEGGKGLIAAARILKRGPYFYQNSQDSKIKKQAKHVVNALVRFLSRNRIQTTASWPDQMRLIFNSQASLQYARENDVPVQNAVVIYPGIDLNQFQFQPRTGIGGPVRILVPGRITPIKGTRDALALYAQLRKANIPAVLTIIGNDFSRPYYEEVETMIRALDGGEEIALLPMVSQEELANLYQKNDICFFPSYQNYGLSRVPIEAMACGCLVITYGNEGSREIIQHSQSGLVIQEGDYSAASKAIIELIQNPSEYSQMTRMARLQVERHHHLASYLDAVESFLVGVAAK